MDNDKQEDTIISNFTQEKGEVKESDIATEESETPLPLTLTSRVLYMLGDMASGPACRFNQWLELVRKRGGRCHTLSFPHQFHSTKLSNDSTISSSSGDSIVDTESSPSFGRVAEISLWERFGKAALIDIESHSFSWDALSSLHRGEHNSSAEHSEDELNKALEVTVNSGGVVFFALFSQNGTAAFPKEAAAVIKIASSRMATQSERLGYELAKWLGVQTPQARVIHNTTLEWIQIKESCEKVRDMAIFDGDDIGEMTSSELLEALDLSRCLFLMNYIHGSPLLESPIAFDSREAAERTGAALGRVLMLDLVIRNEDRLPCRQLRWRGNSANLLLAEKVFSTNTNALEQALDSAVKRYRPRAIKALHKERRATSVDSRLNPHNTCLGSCASDLSDITESPRSGELSLTEQMADSTIPLSDFHIVAIDSGVPRRPPAGKRANDETNYPKFVELLLNSSKFSSDILHDLTGGKLPSSSTESSGAAAAVSLNETASVVHEFRSGFRAALRDLQGFQMFLLTLHQKLDILLRSFLLIINKTTSGDFEKEDLVIPESSLNSQSGGVYCPSPPTKDRNVSEGHTDMGDLDLHKRQSLSGCKDSAESVHSITRDGWHGKISRGSGESLRNLRLTSKLRDFYKSAKVDSECSRELEQWNEMLRNEAVKLCHENNFNTGFFECNDSSSVVDAYELKVRLEHILERITFILDAANTEKPSLITCNLFIGGALAARSVYTLQHLGITHIMCLCSNEIGQSDSQYPDLFEYINFSICDSEDSDISSIFEEAFDFIDMVEKINGKVLVHCFEGKSRSATLVIAYMILRKKYTLMEAWNKLRRVHRRAQPNDGFARVLVELEEKVHGKVSMEWQKRRPAMKVCPICGTNAGLSTSSLKLHLQKSHKKLSAGSVDSAITMEIHKALIALNLGTEQHTSS